MTTRQIIHQSTRRAAPAVEAPVKPLLRPTRTETLQRLRGILRSIKALEAEVIALGQELNQ